VRRSSFVVRRSSFVVRRSSFVVRRSSFVVRRSSFVVPRSPFLVPRSSLVLVVFRGVCGVVARVTRGFPGVDCWSFWSCVVFLVDVVVVVVVVSSDVFIDVDCSCSLVVRVVVGVADVVGAQRCQQQFNCANYEKRLKTKNLDATWRNAHFRTVCLRLSCLRF